MSQLLPNLRHLRAMVEVARLGSVSGAARAMHLSQPAITQAVSALELELGATLFGRNPRGVTLTEPGGAAVARVERLLQQLREGILEVARVRRSDAVDTLQGITAAQLEALVVVVEQGGFGLAARAGGRARATVHRAARQLEARVGVPLFETTSHGLRPTREADRLARRARLAAAEFRQARAEVAALAGDERGQTVIGAMPLARSVIVPRAVLEFATSYPGHAVSILDGPYTVLLGELRRGGADLLIGALRDAPPHDVEQSHLFNDPLALVVRRGHPLVAKLAGRVPAAADLARYPWIAPREGAPLRRQFEHLFGQAGLEPPSAPVECNSLVAARAMLVESDRIMLLSAHQVHYELGAGELAALPHPAGRVVRAIGLTWRRDWHPTQAQSALLAAIRRTAARFGGQDPSPGRKPSRTRNSRGETPARRVKKRVK